MGDTIANALLKGMESLRMLGEIKRAYTSIGFNNPKVEDWVEFSCSPLVDKAVD